MQHLGKDANKTAKEAIEKGMAWALAHAQMCRETIPDGARYLGHLNTCDQSLHLVQLEDCPSLPACLAARNATEIFVPIVNL
jgi:hypothetical protein